MIQHPPPNRQPPKREIVARWLREAYTSNYFATIQKGEKAGWFSSKKNWSVDRIADAVARGKTISGLRPEKESKVIVVDIDKKSSGASQYWAENAESEQISNLKREAKICGCSVSVLRSSSSGGFHIYIATPRMLKVSLLHWVGKELFRRAGIKEASGQAELFPSNIPWRETSNRDQWAKSNGYRLPGQKDSALLLGSITIQDGNLIYKKLIDDIEQAEECENFEELLEAAKEIRKREAPRTAKTNNGKAKIKKVKNTRIRWTKHQQSDKIMKQITGYVRALYPHVTDTETLATLIRDTAIYAEGFEQYASKETKADLTGKPGDWAYRWAASSLRYHPDPFIREKNKKKSNRNQELQKKSRAKLGRVLREAKNPAELSKRKLAELARMARKTVEKHWHYWRQLVAAAVAYTPHITGGRQSAGTSPDRERVPKGCCSAVGRDIWIEFGELSGWVKIKTEAKDEKLDFEMLEIIKCAQNSC